MAITHTYRSGDSAGESGNSVRLMWDDESGSRLDKTFFHGDKLSWCSVNDLASFAEAAERPDAAGVVLLDRVEELEAELDFMRKEATDYESRNGELVAKANDLARRLGNEVVEVARLKHQLNQALSTAEALAHAYMNHPVSD